MATTITGKAVDPSGAAMIGVPVVAKLIATSTASHGSPSGQVVFNFNAVSDSNGLYSLQLLPVSLFPAGAYYEVTVGVKKYKITVPDSGSWELGAVEILSTVPFTGFTGPAIRTYTNLIDAPTVAVNAAQGDQFRLLLTAAVGATRMLGNPTNPPGAGQSQMLLFEIQQDAAGGKALTFDTQYRFGTDIPSLTLAQGANKNTYIGMRYHSTDGKWDIIATDGGY